jgi:transposase
MRRRRRFFYPGIDFARRSLGFQAMRGTEKKQSSMLCLMSPETRVRSDHRLRGVKKLADEVLAELGDIFDVMYSDHGRPSIPPERLLKSMLLMALYTAVSERLFCEQLDYNLLYRWFLDMDMLEPSFDASSFSKNRQRLLPALSLSVSSIRRGARISSVRSTSRWMAR